MRKVLLAVLAFGLAACGTAGGEEPAEVSGLSVNLSPQQNRVTAAKDDTIAAKVPEKFRTKGELVIGGSAGTAPPLRFYATDDKTVIGVETDIASLVADVLGLKPRLEVASWENLFVGLDSGAYDLGLSNITVTEARKEKYDFATYRLDTLAFEAKKGGTWKVEEPKDVAGKVIAVTSGTNQEKILVDWSAANVSAGLKATDIKYFQNSSDYYLALQSGRIDAYLGPNPTSAYHAATSGQTEVIGNFSGGAAVQGKIAATTKKDSGLVTPVQEALNQLIANGKYAEVLKRWGLSDEAVPTSEINPQGLPKS
ncbi:MULTISPECIES: ABC transporter substrate-binding protein [Lentzea]|uniref:Polar amino acid transport system substrate-binding protein n=1 Tax=Lentzea flaviverrucosa TaxID=200379 RepID=A0A1H9G606_9PSEU|nr:MULTISPECIES: ABC transporter substrate-binding protein [Lentzea]MCR3749228.1 polar amino acid transport system substrate-binding protein [Lentzea californiensis]RDI35003.1 polar amino acid transport system substrate-binding protein [Lentzea flaviverrucosa]SEQ45547.1 polar amino acid transport system substrate-binding protein [Lentzea flaviverrucosa]